MVGPDQQPLRIIGDSRTDVSRAIQDALDALPKNGPTAIIELQPLIYFLGSTTGTAITINRPVIIRGNGAQFRYAGPGHAIDVRAHGVVIENLSVVKTGYSYREPIDALTGIGIEQLNSAYCRYTNVGVDGFATGFLFRGDGTGASYTDVVAPRVINCREGMAFRTTDKPGSYCTHIRIFGGTITLGAFVDKTGSRNISLANASSASMDGIVFFGTGSEGKAERTVYCEANHCAFYELYYDEGNGSTDIELTASAKDNVFVGGSALDLMKVRDSGQRNLFIDPKTGIKLAALLDLSPPGGGWIKFPAVPNPSVDPHTLDDYAEGTFRPVVAGSGNIGQAIYGTQRGTYTKIGNRVFFSVSLVWTGHSGSGPLRITGLPYALPRELDGLPLTMVSDAPGAPALLAATARAITNGWEIEVFDAGGKSHAVTPSGSLRLNGSIPVE